MIRGVVQTLQARLERPAPLIGMALLDGTEVNLRVREGGAVTIKPLPRRA